MWELWSARRRCSKGFYLSVGADWSWWGYFFKALMGLQSNTIRVLDIIPLWTGIESNPGSVRKSSFQHFSKALNDLVWTYCWDCSCWRVYLKVWIFSYKSALSRWTGLSMSGSWFLPLLGEQNFVSRWLDWLARSGRLMCPIHLKNLGFTSPDYKDAPIDFGTGEWVHWYDVEYKSPFSIGHRIIPVKRSMITCLENTHSYIQSLWTLSEICTPLRGFYDDNWCW